MTKLKPIKLCRSCSSKNLTNILSLGNQYLSDFVVSNKSLEKYPLVLVLCINCNLLQLKHTTPQSFLYTERYGYKSGINKTMQRELKEIAEQSQENLRDNTIQKIVAVDIGANDGTLLSNYKKNAFRIGVEPIKKFAKDCRKHADIVINDFFNFQSYFKKLKGKKANIITAISCFYDIDDPNKFISDVKKILQENGIFVIQQNYLVSMLKYNAYDNVVHEHLEYYSLLSLENLLKKHNLEVFDVKLSKVNGGSFRTFISNKNKKTIKKSVFKLRKYEKKLKLNEKKIYNDFSERVRETRDALRGLLSRLKKNGKSIFIYGASTRGNTLLQFCDLNHQLIKAAVERNSEKWGKKIASVGIPIISEEQARAEKPDYMLVLPWFFKEEFLRREKDYLSSGGHFIFPLPKIEII
ncbi:MAG: class I SAM-dependent methyltransferase [Candidatus Levybacteria bacterium]|nr:class I SAM-dependent methyltransferase [Candidatus Levybacteria bacterium]